MVGLGDVWDTAPNQQTSRRAHRRARQCNRQQHEWEAEEKDALDAAVQEITTILCPKMQEQKLTEQYLCGWRLRDDPWTQQK
jgi:hypothetical protein